MLRQEVKKIIEELDSGMLCQKTELLIKKLLVAAVYVYEDPDLAACGSECDFDEVFDNPNAPYKLED